MTSFRRLIAGFLCAAGVAHAQDVRLISDEARGVLDEASLLRALDDTAVPQDYIAAARADYRRLLTALYAQGYYGGQISITVDGVEASNIAPLSAPSAITEVVINVVPGPQFTFGEVAIAPLPTGTELPQDLGPRQPARSGEISGAVSGGINSWRDQGYATARVTSQQITARHADDKLDITVALDPGPLVYFGDLSVTGNEDVSRARILQIAGLPSGDVYAPSEIAAAETRLRRAGAFDSVAMTQADDLIDGNILPMTVQLDEAKPRRFGFGLELSSIEGLTVSSFWLHRNLLGGAERFRVDTEIAGINGETGGTDYSINTSFTRPATFGADTDFFITSELSREDEPDYLIDKFEVDVGFSRILSDELTVRAGVGLLTAHEETELGTRDYTLFTLPLDATYDRRDSETNAKSGYYLDLSVTPFISIDDELAGARSYGDARGYISFGEEQQFTLAGRLQIGSVAGADTTEAPADYLFYSGGGGTVRGQSYKNLGVETWNGSEFVTTGGTSFAGAQLEARYVIREKISLVGFYDIGQVGDTAVPLENGDWHAGAGIGLRYDTGIGPIRLDIATQASGDDAGEDVQVYIGIGQAF
ncbi:outer membrane protein assembly factor [Loktanella sp. D2R18]|uniref:autotransporter assembly complex protein TamA n=1 Tax=Rhodobacterales TaxID=204455 RepID=UPI000DEBB487|nr:MULTISPECIES: autotransporter assembly complex family protein [Rhodobacterales]MDO6591290.1 autotransporter assembly complex family protein [Yoonia sp. 1_MG-2023]RBW46243.1 outer membrane protein assembly factor [Loktanella sp. D2R18]